MIDTCIDDFRSLNEAKIELMSNLDSGSRCPCCNQFAKRYKRSITSAMALALILIYKKYLRDGEINWIHGRDFLKNIPNIPSTLDGDFVNLRYWGFLEKKSGEKEDGNPNNGVYRLTPKGIDFVNKRIVVPKYVLIYNSEIFGFVGDKCSITDCLKNRFDYNKVMEMG